MPSFDIVSELNLHEVTNAVDQTQREISHRFDLKDADPSVVLKKNPTEGDTIELGAEADFQLKQILEVLKLKMTKRNIDLAALEMGDVELSGKLARQVIKLKQGIEGDLARRITKTIKDAKTKVQASIQGDKIRVTGKKRDDLQEVIALLREQSFDCPLQFNNFRE